MTFLSAFLGALKCTFCGHLQPDKTVMAFYDLGTGAKTWLCPRCGKCTDEYETPARDLNDDRRH